MAAGRQTSPGRSPTLHLRFGGMLVGNWTARTAVCMLVAVGFELIAGAAEQARKTTVWLTSDEARQSGGLRITWSATPLREALQSLSNSQRLAILLDRRVDPEQPVSITLSDVSPAEAVERTALRQKLGATMLGPLAYLGPPATTRQIRTLAAARKQEAQRLPALAKQAALASRGTAWQDLATPREILETLTAESHVKLLGLEHVPHDLWAAAELPPMPWTDRLTAVAAQLDLTFKFDPTGREVTLIPIGPNVQIERSYPGGPDPTKLADGWKLRAPAAAIRIVDGRIVVRGLLEDHERIHPPRPSTKPPMDRATGKKVHTIRAQDLTLDSLLRQLEERLSVHFEYDPVALAGAGAPITRRVSLDAKQVTLDELLQELFDPLGLRFQRDGATVKVTAPEK